MSTVGLPFFNDVGSNYKFSDKLMQPLRNMSGFDLSYKNDFSAEVGKLYPVFFSYYYPTDSIRLAIDNLLRLINPPVVPITSRWYVYFHLFKVDYSQLWQYWATMMSKGYSGKFECVLPTMKVMILKDGEINPFLARGSLADFLGFNLYSYDKSKYTEDDYLDIPILPFLAYQMIYRNYYLNFNIASSYAQSSPSSEYSAFFPENEYDLMIRSAFPTGFSMDGSTSTDEEPLTKIHLGKMRYRDFATDYFTSSLPWPMRGDVPSLEIGSSGENVLGVKVDGDVVPLVLNGWSGIAGGNPLFSNIKDLNNENALAYGTSGFAVGALASSNLVSSSTGLTGGNPSPFEFAFTKDAFSVTQSALKLLWTNTLITEKLAATDGTYGQFIQTFFGVRPTHYYSHKPTYLGGTYQPVLIEQVLQTSPSDTGTLGTQGATGISSNYGELGGFTADDFGITMCLMSIMPESYYSQGWMREHLYRTQDDFPLPERAALGMQPVTIEELYRLPDNHGSVKKLFGYQSRFDELRYRQNEIHGAVADPTNLSFYPFTQARDLQDIPELNPSFLTTEGNIRLDWLTAPTEIPFVCQVVNRVNATRPYPYMAPPSALMM